MMISEREAALGFEACSEAERAFLVVMRLWFEVRIGGLYQYYSGAAGDQARLAPAALRRIDAPMAAEVMEESNALLGPEGDSADRRTRLPLLEECSDLALERWNELELYFFEDPEDLEGQLSAFAETAGLDD